MALIRNFESKQMQRNSIHDEINASYTVFESDGRAFVQIDTYGRQSRDLPGKKSQTPQLDQAGAKALVAILKQAFFID